MYFFPITYFIFPIVSEISFDLHNLNKVVMLYGCCCWKVSYTLPSTPSPYYRIYDNPTILMIQYNNVIVISSTILKTFSITKIKRIKEMSRKQFLINI